MTTGLKTVVCGVVLLAAGAWAQGVNVQTGDGQTVQVGTGTGGVVVKTGKKKVTVGTDSEGGTAVEVKKKGKTVKVGTTGSTVEVEKSGGTRVQVNTGGGAVEVKGGKKSVVVNTEADGDDGDEGDDTEDGAFVVTGLSSQRSHACTPGQEVEISGSSHTITLTGPCGEIEVSGQGNQVVADVAGAIKVSGVNNAVSWKSALKGRKPVIKKSGVGNSVKQVK